MLVTFRSKAWGNVTMFGDAAETLLKMMGHTGTVPSALLARDIPGALARLKQGLDAASAEETGRQPVQANADDADAPPPVGIRQRAYPLIELLSAAAKQECDVLWDKGRTLD